MVYQANGDDTPGIDIYDAYHAKLLGAIPSEYLPAHTARHSCKLLSCVALREASLVPLTADPTSHTCRCPSAFLTFSSWSHLALYIPPRVMSTQAQAPVFKITPGIQDYAWGKKGSSSLAAQLATKSIGDDFTVDEDKTYAEVSEGDKRL